MKTVMILFLFASICLVVFAFTSPTSTPQKGIYIWKNEQTGGRMGIKIESDGSKTNFYFFSDVYGSDEWTLMEHKVSLDKPGYIVITYPSERLIDIYTFHIKIPQKNTNEIEVSLYSDRNTYLSFKREE